MSFAGSFGTLAARMNGNAFAHALEITLNSATWNPGNGVLTDAMNLSDRACSARSKAYDPRIKGFGRGLTQKIELNAPGLEELGCTVEIADADDRVRDALLSGNQRHSAARIFRVIPGSANDYDTRFTGLLDTWSFSGGKMTLRLKTDERALSSHQPKWPYLRSEWYQMPQDREGTYAAHCYGKHDGTGLTDTGEDPHGMVPTVPVYIVPASVGWHSVMLGPGSLIKDVYVDGVLQVETTDYLHHYGILAGGKIFSLVEFVTIPAEDAVVTVNVYGYAPDAAVPDGTAVITNPVTQIRHFLVNFVVAADEDKARGYAPGGWGTTATIIDSTTWDLVAAYADARGLEGSRFMADQMPGGRRLTEWLESFPVFRCFWSTEGKIKIGTLTPEWPGYWPGTTPIVSKEDCAEGSFSYDLDASQINRKISIGYLPDSVANTLLRSLDVEDPEVEEKADSQLDMHWSPARLVA